MPTGNVNAINSNGIGISSIATRIFTTTGTFTPNASGVFWQVEVVGAGGGGGGATAGLLSNSVGGGGGSGSGGSGGGGGAEEAGIVVGGDEFSISGEHTLHVGDQFLSAGSNDFKARSVGTTAWIANPSETVELLDELADFMAKKIT